MGEGKKPPSGRSPVSSHLPFDLAFAISAEYSNGFPFPHGDGVCLFRSVAQPGRALRSGRRGRRFESSHSDQLPFPSNRSRPICTLALLSSLIALFPFFSFLDAPGS